MTTVKQKFTTGKADELLKPGQAPALRPYRRIPFRTSAGVRGGGATWRDRPAARRRGSPSGPGRGSGGSCRASCRTSRPRACRTRGTRSPRCPSASARATRSSSSCRAPRRASAAASCLRANTARDDAVMTARRSASDRILVSIEQFLNLPVIIFCSAVIF